MCPFLHLSNSKTPVESVAVIGTRKHFEVKNLYKLFCHRKYTVAAIHSLSVHKLQRILLHRKDTENFCQAITLLFKLRVYFEALFVLMPVAFEGLHVDV